MKRINELLATMTQSEPLEYEFMTLHANRSPNSQLELITLSRLDIEALTYNTMSAVLDQLQMFAIDDSNIQYIYFDRMFSELQQYLPKIQRYQDTLMREYKVHVQMPSYFANSEIASYGYTNVFGALLAVNSPLESITVDGKTVKTHNGIIELESGEHTIQLQPGQQIYDVHWNVFSPDMIEPIVKQDSARTVTLFAPQTTVLYCYSFKRKRDVVQNMTYLPSAYVAQPEEQQLLAPIVLQGEHMVVNYYYSLVNDDGKQLTYVYSTDYIRPLVYVEFLV